MAGGAATLSRMQPVTLRTQRLALSIPTAADAAAVTSAARDPEVPRWTTLPSPYERVHADEFIAKASQWWRDDAEYTWAIRFDGVFAGMIGLHAVAAGRSVHGGTAELGYWLAASARGRGLLREAGRAVLDFGFAAPVSLARIEWRAIVGNVASARAAQALGFRYEGRQRQSLADPRGRHDGWVAGLLADDDRAPVPWPALDEADPRVRAP